MNETLKKIGIGVVSILIGNYLISLFPKDITDISPLTVLNSPLVQFGLLAILTYVLLTALVDWLRKLLTSSYTPSFTVVTPRRKPEHIDTTWDVSRFGVDWSVLYGRKRYRGERYAYAMNPLCPRCNAELMEDTMYRRVRSDKEMWKCPGCSFTRRRPSKFIHEEKDVVEKMVEKEVRQQSDKQNRR